MTFIEKELDLCDYRERDYSHHRRLKTIEVYKGEKKITLTKLLEYNHEIVEEDGELKLLLKPVEIEREEKIYSTGGYVQYFKKPKWHKNIICQVFPLAYVNSSGQSGYIFVIRKKPGVKVRIACRYYGWWLAPTEIGYRREEFDREELEEF